MGNIVVFLSIIACLGMCNAVAFAQESQDDANTSTITKDGLVFTVSTDKRVYAPDEIIHITWSVTNTGSEDGRFIETSSCNDGFKFNILDSDRKRLTGLLDEDALLISKNDPILPKISLHFYGDVLRLAKTDPTKQVIVGFMTPNADELRSFLRDEYGITKLGTGGFVGASVMVKDLPHIVKSDLVRYVMGGTSICLAEEYMVLLKPHQTIKNSFDWSQMTAVRSGDFAIPQKVKDGYYSADVVFNFTSNCVTVGIGKVNPSPNMPCSAVPMTPQIQKEIDGMFEHMVVVDRDLKDGYDDTSRSNSTNPPPDRSSQITNNAQATDILLSEDITMHETAGIDGTNTESKIRHDTELLKHSNPPIPSFPPLQQVERGEEPWCKNDSVLLLKNSNGMPACVTPKTAEKLVQRCWAILGISPKNMTLPEPKNQTSKTTCNASGVCFTPE